MALACCEFEEYDQGLQAAKSALKTLTALGEHLALEVPLLLLARLSLGMGLYTEAEKYSSSLLAHASRYPQPTSPSATRIANETIEEARGKSDNRPCCEQLKIWPQSELEHSKRVRAAS
jgi:hypothetical protein